jgi:hypothetical protein
MMTPADEAAKALMRAYADTLQPPPVADIIARAEHTPDTPHAPSTARLRPRRRLVLAAASVAAVIAVVAIGADRLPDRGATTATQPTATQPTPSSAVARAAPGCPPSLPLLDGPHTIEGLLAKPIPVQAGQQLTLTALIPATTDRDRPLLSFRIYLLPHDALINQRAEAVPEALWLAAEAVSQSEDLRLAPDQQRVSPVLQIPTGLAPGTYDIVGYGTYPSPSLCGVTNPAHSTRVGSIWGVLGWVVIH